MTEWVREPGALFAIFQLKGLKKGDQLVKDVDGEGTHMVTINNEDHAEAHYRAYPTADMRSASSPHWRVIAWRRP